MPTSDPEVDDRVYAPSVRLGQFAVEAGEFAGQRGDLLAEPVGVLACGGFAVGDQVEDGGEVHRCRQEGVLVPVSRRTMFAVDAHRVRDTEDSGRLSYSRTRRRCSIRVPLTCSTIHRLRIGTNPGRVSDRLTTSTSTRGRRRAGPGPA